MTDDLKSFSVSERMERFSILKLQFDEFLNQPPISFIRDQIVRREFAVTIDET
jgi:hypothetical protein